MAFAVDRQKPSEEILDGVEKRKVFYWNILIPARKKEEGKGVEQRNTNTTDFLFANFRFYFDVVAIGRTNFDIITYSFGVCATPSGVKRPSEGRAGAEESLRVANVSIQCAQTQSSI